MKALQQFEKHQLEIEQMEAVKGGRWFKKLRKILNYRGYTTQSRGIEDPATGEEW